MNELKPCPFCGNMPEVIEDGYKAIAVHCFNCGADITAETARKAVAAWNRRAQPDNAPLTLEELRGMDGDPVWTEYTDDEGGKHTGWHVVDVVDDNVTLEAIAGEMTLLYVMVKGKDTMYRVSAYRRKPEPEGGDR